MGNLPSTTFELQQKDVLFQIPVSSQPVMIKCCMTPYFKTKIDDVIISQFFANVKNGKI